MSSNGTTTTQTDGTSASARMVDDLLRRGLRVGDPNNVVEIAEALRKQYPREAKKLEDEARGFSVGLSEAMPSAAPAQVASTLGASRLEQAVARVEAEAKALLADRETQDWIPELSAWRETLLSEIEQAGASARLAGDPARLESALLSTVRLGDFARVARLVGCFHLAATRSYRRFAAALDDAVLALRLVMGESVLGGEGSGAQGLLRVPITDAQARVEALVASLDQFASATVGGAPDPVAAQEYAGLLRRTEEGTEAELRPFLRPRELRRILDELLRPASRVAGGARALRSTAQVELARLDRLLSRASSPPPVSAAAKLFVHHLGALVRAFGGDASNRLALLALPAPIAAASALADPGLANRILQVAVIWRPVASREADVFLLAQAGAGARLIQEDLDWVLWLLDQAIHQLSYARRAADAQGAALVAIARTWWELAVADALTARGIAKALGLLSLTVDDLTPALGSAPGALYQLTTQRLEARFSEWQRIAAVVAPRCFELE